MINEEPSVKIGPLAIYIHGRQFANSTDYWDGNWLRVTAECEGEGSRVKVTGAFLHLGELKQWQERLAQFYRSLQGGVDLPTIEPTLKIRLDGHVPATGHLKGSVELTGDHLNEKHRFGFNTDQSYLPSLLQQLAEILRDYPIRDDK